MDTATRRILSVGTRLSNVITLLIKLRDIHFKQLVSRQSSMFLVVMEI